MRHDMVRVNGIDLRSMGDAHAPLMLFLHGFPEFWAAWREPMAHFAARGWLCVAPDLRGYNLSDKPEGVEAYKASSSLRSRGMSSPAMSITASACSPLRGVPT